MIDIFYKNRGEILKAEEATILESLGLDDVLWIDLNNPTGEEKRAAEEFLDTTIQSRAQAEEIESSSRYSETETSIFANTNFLLPGPETYTQETVSFILCEGILVTLSQVSLRSLTDLQRRLVRNYNLYHTGYHILIGILENRIDKDADLIELLAQEISGIGKKIDLGESVNQEIILDINQLQENAMILRENGIDKQRFISSILKSNKFPSDVYSKIEVLNKDVDSLINHSNFSFERLEYLQNTVLGLINLEQNKIMRVFTFVSLLLMPPTLIASVYGMNVKLPNVAADGSIMNFLFIILLMVITVALSVYILTRPRLFK